MIPLTQAMLPELTLVTIACVLFLFGLSNQAMSRRLAPLLALVALIVALMVQMELSMVDAPVNDPWGTMHVDNFARFIKTLTLCVSMLLVLLAWPTHRDGTGSPAIHYGTETGEFFALLLLSVTGVLLVAGANDIMLLFLGIELASIPTYIMVSISRPLPVAQEAGVKYFFLGAMAAALMLFGFSYLYGTTGSVQLMGSAHATAGNYGIDQVIKATIAERGTITPWMMMAVVMLIGGFAFKMAAFPLHVYAADVYQGAATPLTAFLSFIPKASGFVALIKVLWAVGGGSWHLPPQIGHLLWWIAVLTMSCGNVLGFIQLNIKRLFAYSSIAHSGYMLVGVAALVTAASPEGQTDALRGVLYYLTAYGLMNIASFGVLILLPSRDPAPATTAETFEDIAGLGRKYLGLGLAMSVSCFSLIGLPFTVGFIGKVLLIKPAWNAEQLGLVIIMMINAAVSAAYYLKIVAALFLRPLPSDTPAPECTAWPRSVMSAIIVSVAAMIVLGIVLPVSNWITDAAGHAAQLTPAANGPTPAAVAQAQ
jgi:NADH-quinone oxidoreductase subunit N